MGTLIIKGDPSEQSRWREVWVGCEHLRSKVIQVSRAGEGKCGLGWEHLRSKVIWVSRAGEGKCGVRWEHLRQKEIKGDLSEQSRWREVWAGMGTPDYKRWSKWAEQMKGSVGWDGSTWRGMRSEATRVSRKGEGERRKQELDQRWKSRLKGTARRWARLWCWEKVGRMAIIPTWNLDSFNVLYFGGCFARVHAVCMWAWVCFVCWSFYSLIS